MTRRLIRGERLIVASHNAGKVREIGAIVEPYDIETISAGALDLPEPEETGTTFTANAALKALAAAQTAGAPALADDSGLCVVALNGAPGIYSARWAGADKDFSVAMKRIETEMDDAADRSAFFICALCLAWPDGETVAFEGRVDGTLAFPPRGERGFGYDPIFIASGETESFGEMDPEKKHAMSHRARAFALLAAAAMPEG